MSTSPIVRRIILISTILLLLILAWMSLAGGQSQLPRCVTVGQKVETTVQLACGILSLLTALTCFYWQRSRRPIRIAWMISLVTTAGMSSVVWGPPMLTVTALFTLMTLLVGLGIIKLLRLGGA